MQSHLTDDTDSDVGRPKPGKSGAGGRTAMPLLPRGEPLFEDVPVSALNVEALLRTLRGGMVVISGGREYGVALVHEGRVGDAYHWDGRRLHSGPTAHNALPRIPEARASAWTLPPDLLELLPVLMRGTRLYDDLRLRWINWAALVEELAERDGSASLEVASAAGRGVLCLHGGRITAAWTEAAPVPLADAGLLAALVADRGATVTVSQLLPSGAPIAIEDAETLHSPSPFGAMPPEQAALVMEVAQRHLGPAAAAVQQLVDRAVREGLTLNEVARAVRNLTVRAVAPSRLAAIADEIGKHTAPPA